MANYSRWDDIKKQRRGPDTETRAGVEQDLALGQLIYDLRTEAGLSQRELAERMGTTQSVISRLEEGGGRAIASTPSLAWRPRWTGISSCRSPRRSPPSSPMPSRWPEPCRGPRSPSVRSRSPTAAQPASRSGYRAWRSCQRVAGAVKRSMR
jgi:DNA-binding transcriptional regulator YiaG